MPKHKTKFNDSFMSEFTFIKKGRTEYEAKCTTCNTFLSISHGGKSDITDHASSAKHKDNLLALKTSLRMDTFFMPKLTSEELAVASSEGVMAFHCVKHHQSFKSMDCTTKLVQKVFNDSAIAKKFSCAQTKTQALITNVIYPQALEDLKQAIGKSNYIGISTDSSNHGNIKCFPIMVQYFDSLQGLQVKLLQFKNLPNETAETIAEFILAELSATKCTEKVISFGGDNINTNFGGLLRKGVENVFHKLQSNLPIGKELIGVGCCCHVVNNTIQTAVDAITMDVESIANKIFQHFHIYTVRVENLKEFCEFVGTEYKTVLSFSKTRWLSLLPAIERILRLFEALKSYFLSLEFIPQLLKNFFLDEYGEAYLWFIHAQASMFSATILMLEAKKNSIMEVLSALLLLMEKLKQRKNELFLSLKVKALIADAEKNGFSAEKFKKDAAKFYDAAVSYLDKWVKHYNQFACVTWMSLNTANPLSWEQVENSLHYFASKNMLIDDTVLFDEITGLQKFLVNKASDDAFKQLPAHGKWLTFFEENNIEGYQTLLKLVQFVFAIVPHNANVERVFSFMNSQWTDERNSLHVETVRAILTIVFNYADVSCCQYYESIRGDKKYLSRIMSNEKYDKV